jgi:hypothetical protein
MERLSREIENLAQNSVDKSSLNQVEWGSEELEVSEKKSVLEEL